MHSLTVQVAGRARAISARPLAALQQQFPDVKMGSYPRMGDGTVITELVLRSSDEARLARGGRRPSTTWSPPNTRKAGLPAPDPY